VRHVVLVALLASCGPVPGGQRTLPYALEDANAAHQPLVVELGATWCKPCHIFETQVLPDPRVQAALKGIMFVRYDIDTGAGRDAQRRLGTNAVPVVAGIDRDGVIRVYKRGTEATPEHFLEFLREVHMVLDHQR
jgi:thiol:disulfide interchange protein